MARKPQIQARVPSDVQDGLEDYADDHDISRSDALRRIVTDRLQSEGYVDDGRDDDPTDGTDDPDENDRRGPTDRLRNMAVMVGVTAAWATIILSAGTLAANLIPAVSATTRAVMLAVAYAAMCVAVAAVFTHRYAPTLAPLFTTTDTTPEPEADAA